MPLHGKIVVIKRSGVDGTEFPLTASCLFGRKPECDIRIQLPSVSKEHCRIDLNENKEVILTNLSSVNPTCVNGEALHQSERLKNGDVITIVDRSFRFEYPPAPTPKKRSSSGAKSQTLKVLRDQQVSDTVVVESGEKRNFEVSTGPHLKDGANLDNIHRSLEKTLEVESKEDGSELSSKTDSPFSELYQMIKKSLDVKTPRKSCASLVQTPSSKFCTPKPGSVLKKDGKSASFTPKKDEAELLEDPKGRSSETPQSAKKQRKVVPVSPAVVVEVEGDECAAKSEATSKQRRSSAAAQKFTVSEVLQILSAPTFKSPTRRRSKETELAQTTKEEPPQAIKSPKTTTKRSSPRTAGSAEKASKKRKSGELELHLSPKMKKKRVSFGGHLSPELFDKRLPPDSPLRKGAAPRRSLSVCKPKLSLLRRASVIGLLKEKSLRKSKTPSPKKSSNVKVASPKTPPGKKLSKSASPSPKPASSAKKSPQSQSLSPKATSPGKRTPKSASPVQKSPKSRSSSPKSPRPRVTSSKAVTPAKTSPKSRDTSPAQEKPQTRQKSASPGQQTSNTPPTAKERSSLRKSSPASLKNVSLTSVTSVKTPSDSGGSTPMVKGRFSVSLISTPSPTSEADAVTQQEPLTTVTPKIQLKRRSMKSTSRRTPGVSKSARHILQRKSGVSRASMKVLNSWADIVKFGQTKPQVVAPTRKKVTQKTTKKKVSKLQTPARALKGHVSTGHADSPVTIVVGRAHKRTDAHPPGAAPRVVTNTALFKKDLKMDENLSGISEMFKTPANERKRRSLITERSATKTPPEALATSEIEPTLLNTPEEPGEMMVSPLSVASTVKSQRYNSEAVQRLLIEDQQSSLISDTPALEVPSMSSEQQDQDFNSSATPKQKPELPECLTGVKRIMKTPRQKAEPIEDLRGKILKTPRQKAEQHECLTGVKRILKTPRQTVEPLEDIRGKLLITPKQKPVQEECLTGVKRIFKTPKQKAEPLEDLGGKLLKTPQTRDASEVSLDGAMELLETPGQEQKSSHQPEMSNVRTPTIKNSPLMCLTDVRKINKTPKEKYSPVEDMVGVKRLMRTPKQKGEPVEKNFGINRLMKSPRLRGVAPVEDFEGLQELMQEPETEIESNTVIMETLPQEAAEAPQQQPEVEAVEKNPPEEETSAFKVTQLDPSTKEKPNRGRKGRKVKSEDKTDMQEHSEDPVISAPVRGRREKIEAAAPSIVKHSTRGRCAEVTENINPTVEAKAAPRPKRGRNAQKAPEDSAETVQAVVAEEEVTPDSESKQGSSAGSEDKVKDHDAHLKKAELKPKRGRKNKPEQPAEQKQNKVHVQTEEEAPKDMANNEQPEVLSGAMEVVVQAPEVENSPDVEEIAETSTAPVQKKTVRGRRAKLPESKEAEDEQEAAESSDKLVSAPVRGRRGKKPEVTAPPAVKQSTRTRNAKSQENASDQPAPEAEVITEVSQTSLNTIQETKDSTPPTEEVAPKLVRGRKPKPTPVVPENTGAVSCDNVSAEPPQPVPTAAGKPKRGRKLKSDPEEQNEVVMEDVKQQFQPPVSAKRGRNAQQKEEEQEEKSNCQEPVKKLRRTRKPEQEQKEEVQDEAVSPPAEPVVMPEQPTVAEKPRRGGRKAKPDIKAAAPVDSTEAIELPLVSTEEPKRGRRGKQVLQEVITIENPEREVEEQKNASSSPQIIRASRARGRTNEVSQDIPAKRARRGAATPVEITEESAVQTSTPVKPATRGKQASAKPTRAREAPVTSDPANRSEAVKDSKSKKSVKFNSDLQVLEISKATPVKAARGRKSKHTEVKSDIVSTDANKPEEKDLSEEIVKAQPVRRGRRGVKAADVTAESTSEQGPKDTGAEPQPKTRRGRSAKK